LWFSEAALVLQRLWETIEEERQSGFEHRAPKRKTAGVGMGAATISNSYASESEPVFKIVKLDTAIVDANETSGGVTATTNEVTATNMATLMSLYTNNNNNTHKKYSGIGCAKRPSDVLINCFKIDELDLDESKVD
jgi:hypothetical protein